MKVFNLTDSVMVYRGHEIQGNGGSFDFPDLKWVPPRDLEMVKANKIAFGSLPPGWHPIGQPPVPEKKEAPPEMAMVEKVKDLKPTIVQKK